MRRRCSPAATCRSAALGDGTAMARRQLRSRASPAPRVDASIRRRRRPRVRDDSLPLPRRDPADRRAGRSSSTLEGLSSSSESCVHHAPLRRCRKNRRADVHRPRLRRRGAASVWLALPLHPRDTSEGVRSISARRSAVGSSAGTTCCCVADLLGGAPRRAGTVRPDSGDATSCRSTIDRQVRRLTAVVGSRRATGRHRSRPTIRDDRLRPGGPVVGGSYAQLDPQRQDSVSGCGRVTDREVVTC